MALSPTIGFEAHAQQQIPCPTDLPSDPPFPPGTVWNGGQDDNGAYYLIAIPSNWNRSLWLLSHGGPSLNPPAPLTQASDLGPGLLLLEEGWAVAATSYHRRGWAVSSDATDTENLRQLFVNAFCPTSPTVTHGGSFGGPVTNKVAELFVTNYGGVLAVCGLMAGTLNATLDGEDGIGLSFAGSYSESQGCAGPA